jgi:hypothetical protein
MYLAILFNSTIIEMYDDIIQVSHGFEGCQTLRFIAVKSTTGDQGAGNDDITIFLGPLKVHRCWRYVRFQEASFIEDHHDVSQVYSDPIG